MRISGRAYILASIGLLICCVRPELSRADEPAIWFGDVNGSPVLTDAQRLSLARGVFQRLANGGAFAATDIIPAEAAPRLVFLSVRDAKSLAEVFIGAGKGLAAAIDDAVAKAAVDPGTRRPDRINLDIVGAVFPLKQRDFDTPLTLDASLYGLALGGKPPIAFLPEQLIAGGMVDPRGRVDLGKLVAGAPMDAPVGKKLEAVFSGVETGMWRFATLSAYCDADGPVLLYRGHPLPGAVTPESLLASARLGGEYLQRCVGPDGKFLYLYQGGADELVEGYNILRHAGTTHAMLELAEATGDTELLRAAARAVGYLLGQVKILPGKPDLAHVVEDGFVKLGGNGLACVALVKYVQMTGDKEAMPTAVKLGKWIQSVCAADGRFTVHKQAFPNGEVTKFRSVYYPGEAILGLLRLYELDKDKAWLDTAERATIYQISRLKDRSVFDDHWLLYSFSELYAYRPRGELLEQSARLAMSILENQHAKGGAGREDWVGGFYDSPSSAAASTRLEGLCAAYRLVRAHGDAAQARQILDGMKKAAAFIAQTQVTGPSAMHLVDPAQAIGGVRGGLDTYAIRIDYVQHLISATLGLRAILLDQAKPQAASQPTSRP